MNLDIGGQLIASVKTAARRAVVAEFSKSEPTRADCMACGRSIDAEKAKRGGRDWFCSDRCMDAYDTGWPVYGTALADYATKTAHRKPMAPTTKAKRKPRKRILQARTTG